MSCAENCDCALGQKHHTAAPVPATQHAGTLDWGPVLGSGKGHRSPCVSCPEEEAVLTRGLGTAAGAVGTGSEAVNSGCAVLGAPGPAGVCTGLLTPPLGQGARTFTRTRTACEKQGTLGLGRAALVCTPRGSRASTLQMIDSSLNLTWTETP